jgi:uncharacterized protein (TIGR03118 family)
MTYLFSPKTRPLGRRQRATRLELEQLEDRALLSGYIQKNLVSYQPGKAHYTDPNLNGWGLAFAPDGPFWVADAATGVSTVYDHQGNPLPLVVTIPPAPSQPLGPVGSPTGIVYNPTSDFVISKNGKSAPALFLFATLDGTISGWNPSVDPTNAIIIIDNSIANTKEGETFPASYTGLVIERNSSGQNVLYAADGGLTLSTANNRVDMFGGSFQYLGSFTDPKVNVTGSPLYGNTVYQVEDVNGKLFVAFAGFTPPFGGVVDIFNTDGTLLTPNHFTANSPGTGPLVNPWGITKAPPDFGKFSNDILIGNVEQNGGPGDASINAFDPRTGAYLGHLQQPEGKPIAIPGLWDLSFGAGSPHNGKTNELFFTAGPNAITFTGNGLFGMIHAAGDDGGGHTAPPGGSGGLGLPDNSIVLSMLTGIISDPNGTTVHRTTAVASSQNSTAGGTTREAIVHGSAPFDSLAAPQTTGPAFVASPHQRGVQTLLAGLVDPLFVELSGNTRWDV